MGYILWVPWTKHAMIYRKHHRIRINSRSFTLPPVSSAQPQYDDMQQMLKTDEKRIVWHCTWIAIWRISYGVAPEINIMSLTVAIMGLAKLWYSVVMGKLNVVLLIFKIWTEFVHGCVRCGLLRAGFTDILQAYFAGTGAIIRLFHWLWSNSCEY